LVDDFITVILEKLDRRMTNVRAVLLSY